MRRLVAVASLLLVAPSALAAMGLSASDTMPDGFVIRYHLSDTEYFPDIEEGLLLSMVRSAVRDNYAEFLAIGLDGDWPGVGNVYIDDQQGAQCNACVTSGTAFQIHISLTSVARIENSPTSPATYPDDEGAFRTFVGHEMFHNFQNAYVKPSGSSTRMNAAFTEGLARASETLHDYSWVSHNPESLLYLGNVNGCNFELAPDRHPIEFPPESPVQWVATPYLRDGFTTDQSYSACDFWLAWYGVHGEAGLVELLEASFAHREKTGWQEEHDLLAAVTDTSVSHELARFAAAMLTGEGLAWNGLDWGAYLARWAPTSLASGGTISETLRDGGMMGARLDESAIVMLETAGAVDLWRIGDDASIAPVASGSLVAGGGWIVAILPGVGSAEATLTAG